MSKKYIGSIIGSSGDTMINYSGLPSTSDSETNTELVTTTCVHVATLFHLPSIRFARLMLSYALGLYRQLNLTSLTPKINPP